MTQHTTSTGDLESSDTSAGQFWMAEGTLTDGTATVKVNSSSVNISEATANATEAEGDQAIEDGMNNAKSGMTIFTDTQLITATDSSQNLARFDKIAVDDDQLFAANYVTENETAANFTDLGFAYFFEVTVPSTASSITQQIENWVTNLLN